MMKIAFFAVLSLMYLALEGVAPVTVYREGRYAWIQSHFSKTEDVIIMVWHHANVKAFLVPRNSDIVQWRKGKIKGKLLHINSDEYAASRLGHYGILSGNHGSIYGRIITAKDHGFTNAHSGKIILDQKKNRYVFIKTVNKDQFLMHPLSPDPKTPVGRVRFPRHRKEKLFYQGKEIRFTSSKYAQIYPMNVITRNEYLVDGKTVLPERKAVKCQFLDQEFEHGVVAPEAMAEFVRKRANAKTGAMFNHTGKMFYPGSDKFNAAYGKLPFIMFVKNRFRFQQNGAIVNYRTSTFPYSLPLIDQREMMFGWSGLISKGNYQYFYIPKTKKMVMPHRTDKKIKYHCDFNQGYKMPEIWSVGYMMTPKDLLDKSKLPDRFIRVTGKDSPQYGIVLGYSLTEGMTAQPNTKRSLQNLYYFYRSKKMYPYAYFIRNNKPGLTVSTVSYKQYFDPMRDPDSVAFYYHKQKESFYVYFETRKTLRNKVLALPAEMKGKKISVVEMSKSVTLHTPGRVPASGVRISSSGNNGYIVLKLDD